MTVPVVGGTYLRNELEMNVAPPNENGRDQRAPIPTAQRWTFRDTLRALTARGVAVLLITETVEGDKP